METKHPEWLIPGEWVLLARTIHRSSWNSAQNVSINHSYETKQPVQLIRITGFGEAEIMIRTIIGIEKRIVPLSKLHPSEKKFSKNGDPITTGEHIFL